MSTWAQRRELLLARCRARIDYHRAVNHVPTQLGFDWSTARNAEVLRSSLASGRILSPNTTRKLNSARFRE